MRRKCPFRQDPEVRGGTGPDPHGGGAGGRLEYRALLTSKGADLMFRHSIAAAVVVAAVTGGALLLGSPPAAQAAGQITVLSASSPTTNPGSLSVVLVSTTQVVANSISASMYASGSSTPALTVNSFTLTSGKNIGGTTTTWTVASPITQGQLPLGTYRIAVQASDAGGDNASTSDAGTLAFVIYPTVHLTVSPGTASYGQTVTFSGTDIGRYPDGTSKPVAGQQLDSLGQMTTTTASGTFNVTVQAGIGAGNLIYDTNYVQAVADGTTAAAISNGVTVNVITDPVRFTGVSHSPGTVTYPASFTVTGSVSYQSGGTWLPVSDNGISATGGYWADTPCPYGDAGCGYPTVTGQTASDGSFTLAMPGKAGPDSYSIRPTGNAFADYEPWFSINLAIFNVPVIHVALIPEAYAFHVSNHRVTIKGCVTPDTNFVDPKLLAQYPRARFQYAHRTGGPWRTLSGGGAVRTHFGPPKHAGGCYQFTVKPPRSAVYYRLTTPATTAYLATTSKAARASG